MMMRWQPAARALALSASGAFFLGTAAVVHAGDAPAVVYVANDGSGTVSVIETTTNTVNGKIGLGGRVPRVSGAASFRLTGQLGWAGGERIGHLSAREINAAGRDSTLATGGLPRAIAASRDGRRLYVTSQFPDVVSVVDTATGNRITAIPVDLSPEGIALSPDDRFAYVTSFDAHRVSIIDTAALAVIDSVAVDEDPNALAVTPDGAKLYVTHLRRTIAGRPAPGTVSVIDTASRSVVTTIPLTSDSGLPLGITVSESGDRVYVVSFEFGLISVIDPVSDRVVNCGMLDAVSYLTATTTDRDGRLYVTDFADDKLKVVAAGILAPTPGCPDRQRAVRRGVAAVEKIPVPPFPVSLGLTPLQERVYVGSFDFTKAECAGAVGSTQQECRVSPGTVAVIDTADMAMVDAIPVDRFPVGIASAPAPEAVPEVRGAVVAAPSPVLNCYTVQCQDPADCIIPMGKHQAKLGGLRSGDGEHRCLGDRYAATPTPTPQATATPTLSTCVGDCDGNGRVQVEEIVTGVRIALEAALLNRCAVFDQDGDGMVKINELVQGVTGALRGCVAAGAFQ